MADTRAAGTIYDLGYQGYSGARLGRAHAVWRLLVFSIRTVFGVGRGPRARLVPVVVCAILAAPAVGQIAFATISGQPAAINYAQYLEFTTFFLALFAAGQAPEIVVSDRQHGVLALYLSRPLSGTDYALAKLGAIVGAMLLITLVPQLALFSAKVFLSETPWAFFKTEYPKLFAILGGTLGTALYTGSIGLGISSLASRRAFANAGVIAYFLFLPAATSILHSVATGDVKRYVVLANPAWLVTGFANWLFEIEARRRSVVGRADLPGEYYLYTIFGIAAVFIALLLWRYRRSEP